MPDETIHLSPLEAQVICLFAHEEMTNFQIAQLLNELAEKILK